MMIKCGLAVKSSDHHREEEVILTRWSNTTTSSAHDESSTTTATNSNCTTTTTTITTSANWLQLGPPCTDSSMHGLALDLNLAAAAIGSRDSLKSPTTTAVVVATPLTPPRPSFSSSSSFDFKLIRPPPKRPSSSIWFTLLPYHHSSLQPSLPRLSKSFLKIKDQKLRVRLVMKYVAHKLGLNCESQVEIRCKGEVVEPHLTLQHVRDQIWSQNKQQQQRLSLQPKSLATPHLMILHYTFTLPLKFN